MDSRRADVLRASPRMFDSDLLDRFTRVHPVVPLVIFVPAIGIFTGLAFQRLSTLVAIAGIAGGYLFWTLTEYWLHRVVFHFDPGGNGFAARMHWMIHGVHHDHPNDPLRLVMPPALSVPLSLLFYGLFVALLGTPEAFAAGAGFWGGYLFYDMSHYHVHHHVPRSRAGRRLRELHMRHHFQDHTTGFGVSAPYWDHVFGTAPKKRPREDEPEAA